MFACYMSVFARISVIPPMLVVLSSTFTLAFGADFTFWISDLGLSQCHSSLTPIFPIFKNCTLGGTSLHTWHPRRLPGVPWWITYDDREELSRWWWQKLGHRRGSGLHR